MTTPMDIRPATLTGRTRRFRTSSGTIYVTITVDADGHPREVFSALGKAGGENHAWGEAVGRLASLALRKGIPPEEIAAQLEGITSEPLWEDGVQIKSAPDAIGKALAEMARKTPKEDRPQ